MLQGLDIPWGVMVDTLDLTLDLMFGSSSSKSTTFGSYVIYGILFRFLPGAKTSAP